MLWGQARLSPALAFAAQVLLVVHLAQAATLGSHALSPGVEAGACSMALPAQAGAHFNCRLFPQGC